MEKKEPMFEAEVIADGRITIPSWVREAWGIVEGDNLTLLLLKNEGKKAKELRKQ